MTELQSLESPEHGLPRTPSSAGQGARDRFCLGGVFPGLGSPGHSLASEPRAQRLGTPLAAEPGGGCHAAPSPTLDPAPRSGAELAALKARAFPTGTASPAGVPSTPTHSRLASKSSMSSSVQRSPVRGSGSPAAAGARALPGTGGSGSPDSRVTSGPGAAQARPVPSRQDFSFDSPVSAAPARAQPE